VGIAEQHAVTFSAGMATQGKVPFCNIYSSFMQRAYDQVIHDVALQNLPVIFCLDRGGIAGADGPTHHGAYDMAYMRCIPNMVVSAPMDEVELRNLMFTASQNHQGPFSIRYPRGNGSLIDWKKPFQSIPIGKGRKLHSGTDIALLSIGAIGTQATAAQIALTNRGISAAHYDMRFVKPLDELMLHEVFGAFDRVIVIEDGCITGGFGSAVAEFMADNGYHARLKRLGLPDVFVEHGTQQELYAENGYDTNGIVQTAIEMLQQGQKTGQSPKIA
jgi:1-deoxy-D-xylulose-5-phosphate synthase